MTGYTVCQNCHWNYIAIDSDDKICHSCADADRADHLERWPSGWWIAPGFILAVFILGLVVLFA